MMKYAHGALVKKIIRREKSCTEKNPVTMFVFPQTAPHELRIIAHGPPR